MRTTRSRTRTARRGLSLIEVVSALVITSILMLAMGSTIAIATSAIPAGRSTAETTIRQRDVMERMIADLRLANSLLNLDRGADITFTVPDRNGDGQDETIRYAWTSDPDTCTATAGDPIIYQYNGGTPITIARSAQGLGIASMTKIIPRSKDPVTSAEVQLIANDTTDIGSVAEYRPSTLSNHAQSFLPRLPSNTISWSVTRIVIKARGIGGGEDLVVRVVTTLLGLPSAVVLDTDSNSTGGLPSGGLDWVDFDVDKVSPQLPGDPLAFVVSCTGSGYAAVAIERGDVAPADSEHFSGLLGVLWTQDSPSTHLIYRVYGTYTTAGAPIWP